MGEVFKLSVWGDLSSTIFSGSYKECLNEAFRLHDAGYDEDGFFIRTPGSTVAIASHKLEKIDCPVCGEETRVYNMLMTHDCHGIPYRKVCRSCYDSIMDGRGYDGEEYSELDENLDYDY